MAHQMKGLCVFSVFHCVEGAFGAAAGGTPKMKDGAREMNSKMVVVVVGSSLNLSKLRAGVWQSSRSIRFRPLRTIASHELLRQ